jgi:hypothetical protein
MLAGILGVSVVGIGLIVLMFIGTIYGAFFNALAGWQLWQWFALPLGLPDLTGWQIAGFSLLVSFLTYKYPTGKSDDSDTKAGIVKAFIYPPLTALTFVFSGWIIAKIMGLA